MAGVIDTGITFVDNEVITSAKMNNIIDQTTFTGDAVDDITLSLGAGKLQVKTQGITSGQMANNAVTTASINNLAVTTEKINDLAVTTGKITDASVTTSKILDANVTTAKIANASVTAAKLSGAQTGTAPVFGVRAAGTFLFEASRSLGDDPLNAASATRVSDIITRVTFTTPLLSTNYSVVVSYSDAATSYTTIPRIAERLTTSFSVTHANEGAGRTMSFIVVG